MAEKLPEELRIALNGYIKQLSLSYKAVTKNEKAEEASFVKKLIFTKPKENYKIPLPTNTLSKVYACLECGDKFLFESSYIFHINRRSLKITYNCQQCSKTFIFFNRCKVLRHIRSHVVKSLTLNLSDINLDILPELKKKLLSNSSKKPKSDSLNCNKSEKTSSTIAKSLENNVKITNFRNHIECPECKAKLQRCQSYAFTMATHFNYKTADTDQKYTCELCSEVFKTNCALQAHYRFHTLQTPLVCTKCCMKMHTADYLIENKHNCDIIEKIKTTSYFECLRKCGKIKHENFTEHFCRVHMTEMYHCQLCKQSFPTFQNIKAHAINKHQAPVPTTMYYKCNLCICTKLNKNLIDFHAYSHLPQIHKPIVVCRNCSKVFESISELIDHYKKCILEFDHSGSTVSVTCKFCKVSELYRCHIEDIDNLPKKCPLNCVAPKEIKVLKCSSMNDKINLNNNESRQMEIVPRTIEALNLHKNYDTSVYIQNEENVEPHRNNEPLVVRLGADGNSIQTNMLMAEINTVCEIDINVTETMVCGLCKNFIPDEWPVIKQHFKENHKEYKCLDLTVKLDRYDLTNINTKKRRRLPRGIASNVKINKKRRGRPKSKNPIDQSAQLYEELGQIPKMTCKKCNYIGENQEEFEKHVVGHRDKSSAYQCMECGQCFITKHSFNAHLIVAHSINNVDQYINEHDKCFAEVLNESAEVSMVPVKENQCRICREQFLNATDLEKHFRVHGMAFLMAKKNKTPSP